MKIVLFYQYEIKLVVDVQYWTVVSIFGQNSNKI